MIASASRWVRRARRAPLGTALGLVALGIGAYVVAGPLCAARYPMMTDLPFHAASAAVFRHYWDPAWHFREQFVLQPFAVPYVSMYALAALLMLVMPALPAIKIAAGLMLALLPVGLAVLAHGMRKSPLLGLAGLGFVWCGLTSWGFINFMAALGLFAMVVGLALRALHRPSRGRSLALGAALVALFFTHVFRFPFALAAVAAAALLLYPATRRWRPVVAPLVLGVALLGLWLAWRPEPLAAPLGPIGWHAERLGEIESLLYRSLRDPAEARAAGRALRLLGAVAIGAAALGALQGRWQGLPRRRLAWSIGAPGLVLSCAAVFLVLFLVLPMQIGLWWYVYPREITAACFVALGALPDLPRQGWLKAAFVAALGAAVVPLGRVTADNYRGFDAATADFASIVTRLPQAPKLLYLVFDHQGSSAISTPFIHLPAYVQAERGGWLSFHFASWGASPVGYRGRDEPGAVVPPPTPLRWEWTPDRFRVATHGPFFDWFLVRRRSSPDLLFHADPSIVRVAHHGSWWLYQRVGPRPSRYRLPTRLDLPPWLL
ncbi:MAG: hypothetical protein HY744_19995 [Deltaproteobacteria bacterium]|nr:hypothetical protein [Deltaproteobacteria bacterium]